MSGFAEVVLSAVGFVFSWHGFLAILGVLAGIAAIAFARTVKRIAASDGHVDRTRALYALGMLGIIVASVVTAFYLVCGFFLAVPILVGISFFSATGLPDDMILPMAAASGLLCLIFCPAGFLFGFLKMRRAS